MRKLQRQTGMYKRNERTERAEMLYIYVASY